MNAPDLAKKIVTSKYLYIGLAVIIVLVIVTKLLRKIFKPGGLLSSTTEADEIRKKEVQKGISNISTNPNKRSKTTEQLAQRADAIYQAMYGLGTNEDLVFDSLKGLNVEDLKEVYKQFGVKEEKWFAVTTFTGDLFGWFLAEFEVGTSELAELKKIFAPTNLWF